MSKESLWEVHDNSPPKTKENVLSEGETSLQETLELFLKEPRDFSEMLIYMLIGILVHINNYKRLQINIYPLRRLL